MYVKIQGYKTILVETITKFIATPAAQITDVVCVANVSSSLDGTYFYLWRENADTLYCVWMDCAGGGNQPDVKEIVTYVPVTLTTDDTDDEVAAALEIAIDGLAGIFTSIDTVPPTLVITQVNTGRAPDAIDINTGFTITIDTVGLGVTLIDGNSDWWRITGKQILVHDPPRGMEDKRIFDFIDVQEIVWAGMISEIWD